MAAGDLAAHLARLLDRVERRVLMGRRFDAQLFQPGIQVFGARRHGLYLFNFGRCRSASRWSFFADVSIAFARALRNKTRLATYATGCGRSSGVERNLAKVEVVSSNLIARSNHLLVIEFPRNR